MPIFNYEVILYEQKRIGRRQTREMIFIETAHNKIFLFIFDGLSANRHPEL